MMCCRCDLKTILMKAFLPGVKTRGGTHCSVNWEGMIQVEDYILRMEHVTKTFPGVKALDDVTFKVKRGEIHGLVGENGAGKSTLMKVLSGVYPAGTYTGKMYVDDEERNYTCIKDSEHTGVVIIYQELGMVQSMTVCENIFLGNEKIKGVGIDWNYENAKSMELLKKLNLDIDPGTEVGQLGTGVQQLLEIAKALNKNVKLLILDEPTSSLTEADAANLLELLRELKEQGVTCIFISHKLSEVLEIADNITVLRDGRTILTAPSSEMTEDKLIACMVGREMKNQFPHKDREAGEVVLEVKDWTIPNPEIPHKNLLNHIHIHVRKGEILGIAGLMGAGRTELATSIYGALGLPAEGTLLIDGEEMKHFTHPKQAIHYGIGYVSEDRNRFGLVLPQSVKSNLSLASLDKLSSKLGIINGDKENDAVNGYIRDFRIKTPTSYQLVENLSGGNRQKVVLGKALMARPKVLIVDEPTRGIDVGAKYEIYQLMNQLVDEGICIVMISSELPEVIGMSDRIYVMHEGDIQAELIRGKDEITQEVILFYASGGEKNGN